MNRIKATFYLDKQSIQAIDRIQALEFDRTEKKRDKSQIVREAVLKLLQDVERGE